MRKAILDFGRKDMLRKTVQTVALAILFLMVFTFALSIQRAMAATNIYDLNGDGKVDINDLAIASAAFGTAPGHPKWNLKADVNSDGKIDIVDLGLVASHFGEHSP
jgi:uncharacterized protein (DUF2141 family)